MGLALRVVMLSKQRVKVTTGTDEAVITILFDDAGLFEMQVRFEVIKQRILSPVS